jgi:GNAT superfamily N-acetyltransferase
MCDEWMTSLSLELTDEQFRRLPRSAAYRYAYHEGVAWVNPRPRYYHLLLDLSAAPAEGSAGLPLRPVGPEDWEAMAPAFAAAFAQQPPFCGLDEATRLRAVSKSLTHTRTGGDGPWVEAASFVAVGEGGEPIVGAVLVTLLPERDPCDWGSYHWTEPPPPDAVARGLGRPHLTWIFVVPEHAGRGLGTSLLAAAAGALRRLGYRELASTFLLGNDSSVLWHWRSGFRLLSYPGSRRRTP